MIVAGTSPLLHIDLGKTEPDMILQYRDPEDIPINGMTDEQVAAGITQLIALSKKCNIDALIQVSDHAQRSTTLCPDPYK